DRRPRVGRPTSSPPAGVHRGAGLPVRLLRQRHGHGGQGAARPDSAPPRAREQAGAQWTPLPLRLAQPDPPRPPARRPGDAVVSAGLGRRDFLRASGSLVVWFSLVPNLAVAQDKAALLPGSLNTNRMLDAWLRIAPSGTVTIFTGKIEL